MKNLNILISHSSIYKNAGWGRIFPLATNLANDGNYVTILTTNPNFSIFSRKLNIENVNIILSPEIIPSRISRMGFGFLSMLYKIFFILVHPFDIVHSDSGHRPLSGIPCRLHKKIHNSVYVAEWYDWFGKGGLYDHKNKIFKFFLGRYELKYEIKDKVIADGIVVLSEIMKERALKIKSRNRIIKIHGGADVLSIPFIQNNNHIKTKYNLNEDSLTFGYISSISYNLNEFLPIINAIDRFKDSVEFKILVFGKANGLANRIPKTLAKYFVFFGWIDFRNDYEKLQCVDVFLLFKEETLGTKAGWPNCLGDYLACGRPVFTHPVGEVIPFAIKYPYAFIKTSLDIDDIYSKIEYIINNIDILLHIRKDIRKLAENNVSWKSKSDMLHDFYTNLIRLNTQT